jgi:chemotaxis protein MotB
MMLKEDKNVIYVKMPSRLNWMTTFCDMLTILLCFFVLIISMSSMESKALQKTLGFFTSVKGPLGFTREHETGVAPLVSKPLQPIFYKDAESLNRDLMLALSKRTIGIAGLPGRGTVPYEVQETDRGYAIRVSGDILFDKGSQELRRDALHILQGIADVVKSTDSTVSIEGNTDSFGNEQSNWKLSLQRAISVMEYFEYTEGLSPCRFCVAGYGSMRPVVSNDTADGRVKNRRVDIILLKDRV